MSALPLLVTAVAVALGLGFAHWILYRRSPTLGKEERLPRHLAMAALGILALVALVVALPLSAEVELHVLGLIGIIISGAIALGSNNVLANAMSGLMLRLNRPFLTGDHIRVGEFSGRVTERGLFDTEIQTAGRELVSLPNAYLSEHPVVVLSNQGVLLSVSVPIDDEVHHTVVEDALVKAATDIDLTDAFTEVADLSDEAITYRVSGMISDDRRLITTRSELHRAILDRLDHAGIRLVGPEPIEVFRAERASKVKPRKVATRVKIDIDQLVFDKAEKAEAREQLSEEIAQLREQKEVDPVNSQELEDRLALKLEELEALEKEQDSDEGEALNPDS